MSQSWKGLSSGSVCPGWDVGWLKVTKNSWNGPNLLLRPPGVSGRWIFWQSSLFAVFIWVLFLAPCNTFVLFHLTHIDFFLLFPGLQLGSHVRFLLLLFIYFFKFNFLPYLCVVVGKWLVMGPGWVEAVNSKSCSNTFNFTSPWLLSTWDVFL